MRWSGGRSLLKSGYVQVWDPVVRSRLEHRVVAERMIGRALRPGEQVHHINGIRDDNRPENLRVLGIREHALLHVEHHFVSHGRWARDFDACTDCGRTTVRHARHGRCGTCDVYFRKGRPANSVIPRL